MRRFRFGRALQLAFLLCILLAWCIPGFCAGVPSLLVGGGYGNSGATISSAGALSMDGAFISKGNFTLYNSATSRFAWTASTGGLVATPAATTGVAWYLNGSTLTTGDLLKLTCLDTPLNGGKYLNCYGGTGTTSEFSIGEGGAVTTLGDVASATLTTGGGYGSTGCSVAATGNVQTNGTLTVDGTTALNGGITCDTNKFTVADTSGNTAIAGTLSVAGATTLSLLPVVSETGASRNITSADFGSIVACSYAGATSISLPNPSAGIVGGTVFIAELVDQTLTIIGGDTANNNQIIADGVLTSDNVAFSTASHKIGSMARATCISATKWLITNASSCAMTVEVAD